jgi:rSAM/selenodomain-associated transferase 1
MTPALLVIAKAPVAGRVKTRLCPPCTPEQAARLARAALEDTLAACDLAAGDARRVLVLAGRPGPWLPPGWEVVPQRGAGLAVRLAAAFEDCGEPALLVGMDTPQVAPAVLADGLAALAHADAVFGPATDGGYWAIGLRVPDAAVFAGVPMSRVYTGAIQRARLAALGLRTVDLPPLRDVDDIAAARAVAAQAPGSRFAATLAEIDSRVAAA